MEPKAIWSLTFLFVGCIMGGLLVGLYNDADSKRFDLCKKSATKVVNTCSVEPWEKQPEGCGLKETFNIKGFAMCMGE